VLRIGNLAGKILKISVFILMILKSFIAYSEETPNERIIVGITLNGEAKGEYLIYMTPERDFLLKVQDIGSIGLREVKGVKMTIEGEEFISLKSIDGLEFRLDEKNLVLELTASPYLLSKNIKSLLPPKRLNVYYPRGSSAFLNFSALYSGGKAQNLPLTNITSTLGIRKDDLLFLTNNSYTKSDTDNRFVRLMSSLTYEKRAQLQWFVFGDFFASSGDLGSNLNMGGFSFSKVYKLDPYLVKQPVLDLSGVVPFASEAEIYLDGNLIGREKLQPGQFELRDISYYGGMRTVEIVIKDPFGKEQRIIHPFYFTDILLKKGLNEYSYNIGFLREKYNIESNKYGDPAISFYHRYGVSDSLNFGFRAEATEGLFNFGPQLAYRVMNFGVLSASLATSMGDESGTAGSFYYTFQTKRFNARLLLKGYTDGYSNIESKGSSERPKSDTAIGATYSTEKWGAFSLDYSVSEKYQGEGRRTATATYTTSIGKDISLFATLRNIQESDSQVEFFIGLNYYPKSEYSISSNYQKTKDAYIGVVQSQKSAPQGEGWGYRATLENRSMESGDNISILNPYFQYNSRYGIYTGEYRGGSGIDDYYNISAAGAIVYKDGLLGFTRPVSDSFGFFKVGELKNVRVLSDGSEIGRTDGSGDLIVPNLRSYYHNKISFEPSDIPIDYKVSVADVYLSPSLWSGSCIFFDAQRLQAFTGTIYVMGDADMMPIELYEIKMKVDEETSITFPTGRGGEFYFENILPSQKTDIFDCRRLKGEKTSYILPGKYKAEFEYRERRCVFDIVIPKSDDVIVDLGRHVCKIE